MSLTRYTTYRETGLEWLETIPTHWEVKRLKQFCSVFPSNVDKKSVEGETPVKLCNYTDVYYNDFIAEDLEFMEATATEEQIKKFTLQTGDTIITKDSETADDIAIAACVTKDLPGVICGYHLSVVRPKEVAYGAFVKRLFDSIYAKSLFAVRANGLTRVGLSQYAIDNVELPLPPIKEQKDIATFLDRETSKIDALITEQQRLIELLQEKQQAVISHAVTKGLNPNAPMKDSGVEWLGEVPEHWEVKSLRMATERITYGFTNPMPTDDSGPYMLTANDIDNGRIRFESCRRTSEHAFFRELTDKSRPVEGDVLLTKDGTLGRVALYAKQGEEACINQSVALLRPNTSFCSGAFLAMALMSGNYQEKMVFDAGGTTIKHIYISRLAKMAIALPPLSEQEKLLAKLQNATRPYELLVANSNASLILLRERRSALISAAVTGQIDVRGLVTEEEP